MEETITVYTCSLGLKMLKDGEGAFANNTKRERNSMRFPVVVPVSCIEEPYLSYVDVFVNEFDYYKYNEE